MKSIFVTVIVPKLPPAIDGLGDYGLRLAMQICQEYDVQVRFVVATPEWSGPSILEGFQVEVLKERTANCLFETLNKSEKNQIVLLHYVGYGYERRGCPFWLKNGLDNYFRNNSKAKLLTMFHEVYADGPFWSKQFWTSFAQKSIAKSIANLSTQIITSKEKYKNYLLHLINKNRSIEVIPVFSNVGESNSFSPLKERERVLVIFGGQKLRANTYQYPIEKWNRLIDLLQINKIVDIGEVLSTYPDLKLDIQKKGALAQNSIHEILSNSTAGIVSYPRDYLEKSGVFASYCAHGLIPIVIDERDEIVNEEVPSNIYVHASQVEMIGEKQEVYNEIAQNAFGWYQNHNLTNHAKLFYKLIKNNRHE
jgi:hypothetical protein